MTSTGGLENGVQMVAVDGHASIGLDWFAGELALVHTPHGALRVTITKGSGAPDQPLLLTVPDVGTSSRDCFAATMAAPLRASSVGKAELALPDIFRLAHVHHPGCADADANPVRVIGVPGGNGSASPSTLDAFGDAVGAVAAALSSELGTAPVVGLGQGAGGYALALAASRKRAVLKGLVLVSPLSRSAGWTETFNVRTTAASLSYRGGASNGVVNYVASRIFGHIALGGGGPGSDCARAYRQRLAEHLNGSFDARAALSASLSMLASRPNLVERGDVGRIACRTLIICGVHSAHRDDALALSGGLPMTSRCSFLEVDNAGAMAEEESPGTIAGPIRALLASMKATGLLSPLLAL